MTTFLYSPVIVVDPGVPPAAGDAQAEVLHGGHSWPETDVRPEVYFLSAGIAQLPGEDPARHGVTAELLSIRTLRTPLCGSQVEDVGINKQDLLLRSSRRREVTGGGEEV